MGMAEDAEGGSSLSMTVQGSEVTRNVTVKYCPIADVPFEYCEFFPDFKKSKAWFAENWKEAYPEVEDDGLVELMTKLGVEGEPDAHAKRAQATKKPAAEPAPAAAAGEGAAAAAGDGAATLAGEGAAAAPPPELSKKDKKKKEAAPPATELNTRNKKKFTTCIRGLENFEVDVPAAAKVFGKKFACGSAFQKGKNGLPDQIEIQGNYKDELPEFLVSKFKISMDVIFALEGGKKVPISAVAID